MTNKYLLAAFVLLVFVIPTGCKSGKHSKSKALPGIWQAQPIIIDGDNKDWPSPYPNFDSKSKIGYATSNDEGNLYITMETGDELTQMKILKWGMAVLIDTSGGKSPQFTINFPLQNDMESFEIPKAEERQRKNDESSIIGKQIGQKIKSAAGSVSQYALEGIASCNGVYMVSQTSPCGIKVKLSIDEYKELVWEAQIPFKAIFGEEKAACVYTGKPITVCFSIKGYKKPNTKGNENASAPGMNNGMGGMGARGGNNMRGGGGGGGGVRSNSENPLQHLYENTKTWKQFLIAGKP